MDKELIAYLSSLVADLRASLDAWRDAAGNVNESSMAFERMEGAIDELEQFINIQKLKD